METISRGRLGTQIERYRVRITVNVNKKSAHTKNLGFGIKSQYLVSGTETRKFHFATEACVLLVCYQIFNFKAVGFIKITM